MYTKEVMGKYKTQHWLPSGYMKSVSVTGIPEKRKTEIYYSNDVKSKIKRVEKLSYNNYHYTKIDAKGAETSFHQMENEYPLIAEKVIKGGALIKKEYFGLILITIDFHARTPPTKLNNRGKL